MDEHADASHFSSHYYEPVYLCDENLLYLAHGLVLKQNLL